MKPIITNNVRLYIQKTSQRKHAYWRYKKGLLRFYHKGEWLPESQFNAYYPIYEYKRFPESANKEYIV